MGKRIKFRAEGIYSKSQIFINGKNAGSHDGGATPFEFDITDLIKTGRNEIIILVSDHSDASRLDAMTYYAHFSIGGIWRIPEIFTVEPLHISKLAIQTDFDNSYHNAELHVDMSIVNEQDDEVRDAEIKFVLHNPDNMPRRT